MVHLLSISTSVLWFHISQSQKRETFTDNSAQDASHTIMILFNIIKTSSSSLKGIVFAKLVWGNLRHLENLVNSSRLDFKILATSFQVNYMHI